MTPPASVRLFGVLFAIATALSIALASHAAHGTSFGFIISPDAAALLAHRILAIRLAGCLFAIILMALVLIGRSRSARGTLLARWLLGFVSSIAFLRGIGLLLPHSAGTGLVALSLAQSLFEGIAILVLYGEDAGDWFADPRAIAPGR